MDSVRGQTLTEIEILICDDGSTDRTRELLQTYAGEDPRIRILVSPKRQGLAAALNRCIRAARGEYLARQDADDLSAPDRLERQAVFLKRHPQIDFVGTSTILYNSTGDWGRRILPAYPRKEDFLFTNPFVHGSLMFRKRAFETAGMYRSARLTRRAEDYELLMRMYAAGLRGANLQQPLYRFLEDRDACRRRKYRYRMDETIVRLQGFGRLGLLPRGLPYAVKPLAVGLIPDRLLQRLRHGHTIQIEK